MPELPDVETFRRYLNATSLHKTIEDARVKDASILDGISSRRLKSTLRGHKLQSTRRHGKHLFAQLDKGGWLALHFGMTGFLRYFKHMDDEPEHDRLLIKFRNGYHLAYDCQRKFGSVSIVDDPDDLIEEKKLGPDALDISLDQFKQRLGRARGSVKTALMNQKLIAGIGNEYSDEVLFQARIHPKADAGKLSPDHLKELHRTMLRVLNTTVERQADPGRFPRTYLNRRREEGAPCPRCKGKVRTIKASGRTAYFCPKCQERR